MLASNPLFGALFESALVQELHKQVAAGGIAAAWYHWRSAGGAEVDLLLEKDDTLFPFEFNDHPTFPALASASRLVAFKSAYPGRNIGKGAVICAVEKPYWIMEDVMAIPLEHPVIPIPY